MVSSDTSFSLKIKIMDNTPIQYAITDEDDILINNKVISVGTTFKNGTKESFVVLRITTETINVKCRSVEFKLPIETFVTEVFNKGLKNFKSPDNKIKKNIEKLLIGNTLISVGDTFSVSPNYNIGQIYKISYNYVSIKYKNDLDMRRYAMSYFIDLVDKKFFRDFKSQKVNIDLTLL